MQRETSPLAAPVLNEKFNEIKVHRLFSIPIAQACFTFCFASIALHQIPSLINNSIWILQLIIHLTLALNCFILFCATAYLLFKTYDNQKQLQSAITQGEALGLVPEPLTFLHQESNHLPITSTGELIATISAFIGSILFIPSETYPSGSWCFMATAIIFTLTHLYNHLKKTNYSGLCTHSKLAAIIYLFEALMLATLTLMRNVIHTEQMWILILSLVGSTISDIGILCFCQLYEYESKQHYNNVQPMQSRPRQPVIRPQRDYGIYHSPHTALEDIDEERQHLRRQA